ncbi:hypothetical protein NDU88_001962 [Pleurodeles waltl]|uniref:Uncharacterized protein n=1 Tax=Pleurodeles waltl TaxID=8319 RepID=A0AAV7QBB7_PLEWA|nr:hypothetical protein NDU88_001962 [Pleurodeles waltl]
MPSYPGLVKICIRAYLRSLEYDVQYTSIGSLLALRYCMELHALGAALPVFLRVGPQSPLHRRAALRSFRSAAHPRRVHQAVAVMERSPPATLAQKQTSLCCHLAPAARAMANLTRRWYNPIAIFYPPPTAPSPGLSECVCAVRPRRGPGESRFTFTYRRSLTMRAHLFTSGLTNDVSPAGCTRRAPGRGGAGTSARGSSLV